jgi:hypothetical protein
LLQRGRIVGLALYGFGSIGQLIRIVAEIHISRVKPYQISLPHTDLATLRGNDLQPQIKQRLVLLGLRLMLCLDLRPPLLQVFDLCPCHPGFDVHLEQSIAIQLNADKQG